MATDEPLPLPATDPERPDPLHHRGLVITFAKRYRHCGIEWDDLIQVGSLGLLRACAKFDPARDRKFSTYAKHWIKAAILRALYNQARPLRVPIHVRQQLGRGVRPSDPGLSAKQRSNLESALAVIEAECNPVTEALAWDPEAEAEHDFAADVTPHLAALPWRERDVLVRYYGIEGPHLTYDELAAEYGLSKQRIAQLVKAAVRRLRRAVAKHP